MLRFEIELDGADLKSLGEAASVGAQRIGDGRLLELLLKYGPLILQLLFGIKLPPIPVPVPGVGVDDKP